MNTTQDTDNIQLKKRLAELRAHYPTASFQWIWQMAIKPMEAVYEESGDKPESGQINETTFGAVEEIQNSLIHNAVRRIMDERETILDEPNNFHVDSTGEIFLIRSDGKGIRLN